VSLKKIPGTAEAAPGEDVLNCMSVTHPPEGGKNREENAS